MGYVTVFHPCHYICLEIRLNPVRALYSAPTHAHTRRDANTMAEQCNGMHVEALEKGKPGLRFRLGLGWWLAHSSWGSSYSISQHLCLSLRLFLSAFVSPLFANSGNPIFIAMSNPFLSVFVSRTLYPFSLSVFHYYFQVFEAWVADGRRGGLVVAADRTWVQYSF